MPTKLLDLEPQRRDAILNAALKEFVTNGFDHASTNIIAKATGMSKALMFHYVNNKKDLFLFTYDYFTELMDREYFDLIDFSQKDIFVRLRQSYLLQLELLKRYPKILEFNQLSTSAHSVEINQALEERTVKNHSSCYNKIFDTIDESNFRQGLDIEKCKQFIFWSNVGFTNQILDEILHEEKSEFDDTKIVARLDEYLEELRKIFYQ